MSLVHNIFTKEIRIKLNRKSNETFATYVIANSKDDKYNEKRWNANENLFNWIDLTINLSREDNSIVELIMHELDHAYDDWQQYKNNGTTYQYKYIKNNYSVFQHKENDDDFTRLVKAINYVFLKYEIHAYIVQIHGEINRTFNNISEAYDWLNKNSTTWKQLKIVKNNIEYILQNDNYKSKYCETIRNIINTKKDDKKLLDELKVNVDKYWKKIINHVYIILVKNCINESNITLAPTSKSIFIKEIKDIK